MLTDSAWHCMDTYATQIRINLQIINYEIILMYEI